MNSIHRKPGHVYPADHAAPHAKRRIKKSNLFLEKNFLSKMTFHRAVSTLSTGRLVQTKSVGTKERSLQQSGEEERLGNISASPASEGPLRGVSASHSTKRSGTA
jgi:hypothetical protein